MAVSLQRHEILELLEGGQMRAHGALICIIASVDQSPHFNHPGQ
jgi:hypothetical protein